MTGSRAEAATVNAAGLVQGIALVTFPAASTIFTARGSYGLSSSQYGLMFVPQVITAVTAALLGADAALATRLAVGGDLLTGRYEGRNCRGAEKYARLTAWLFAEGIGAAHPEIWAYGNSRGDLRLLDAADHGVDAGRLGRAGRLRRFPSLSTVAGSQGPA